MKSTAHGPRSTVSGLPAAFTLIEVLVAMTVLSVMILMVANIFQSSSVSWNIGTQKADMNTAARAALDFMARELACAVAGKVEAASQATSVEVPFKLENGTNIIFVALSGEPNSSPLRRALRGNCFQHDIEKRTLKYERWTDFDPYSDSSTWGGGSSLKSMITNVWSLTMIAFTNESGLNNGSGTDTFTNSLPLCLDIAIEMLSGDDMKRALTFASDTQPQRDYVARNAKVYTTRIYFPNRKGYGAH